MSLIEVKNISLRVNGNLILNRVSFDLDSGDYVGLIGPNGAGKTTLIKIILGLQKPNMGQVKKNSNLKFGYVPQNYTFSPIVPISVKEVLLMSGRKEKDELVNALKKVELDTSFLKKNFHNLSGGQAQRVIVARALCAKPDVLICDEPLNGIDYETKLKLYELLSKLNQSEKLTILFVSHEVDHIIDKCHRVLCLNKSLHQGCHPMNFIKGKNKTYQLSENSLKILPIHHHH